MFLDVIGWSFGVFDDWFFMLVWIVVWFWGICGLVMGNCDDV